MNKSSPSSPPQQQQQQPQSPVLVVRATHEYVPVNNDELHIRVNDIITITNAEEGGWWEGTLGSKTGWFPSNYVIPLEPPGQHAMAQVLSSPEPQQTADEYRLTIVRELMDSEGKFVREMEEFLNSPSFNNLCSKVSDSSSPNLLQSLKTSYSNILATHNQSILNPLKSHVSSTPNSNSLRIGKIFLTAGVSIQTSHTNYCRLHPKFVSFIESHQDNSNANEPDAFLRIITCLSAPFRRITAYGGLLNELECHVESFNPDRGDLQRSVAFYRELEKSLNNLRKQKEMELEVLVPGAIKDYEGTEISALGEIMLMNLMVVGKERLPRYFVLFPNTIVILAYDSVQNQFMYHGRIVVSGVAVSSIPDGEYQGIQVANAMEISGPTIHALIAQCPTPAIKSTWISTLSDLIRKTRCYSNSPSTSSHNNNQILPPISTAQHKNHSSTSHSHLLHVGAPLAPPLQAWNITRLRPSPPFNPFLAEYLSQENASPSSSTQKLSLATRSSSSTNFNSISGMLGGGGSNNSMNMNKSKSGSFSGMGMGGFNPSTGTGGGEKNGNGSGSGWVTNEDDFAVLSIVDAFCSNGRTQQQQLLRKQNEGSIVPPGTCSVDLRKHLKKSLSTGTDDDNHLNNNNANRKKKYSWCCGRTSTTDDFSKRQPVVTRVAPVPRSSSNKNPLQQNHISDSAQSVKSLPHLVLLLRDDITVLNDRINHLTRQLEDETSARMQLMNVLGKVGGCCGGSSNGST